MARTAIGQRQHQPAPPPLNVPKVVSGDAVRRFSTPRAARQTAHDHCLVQSRWPERVCERGGKRSHPPQVVTRHAAPSPATWGPWVVAKEGVGAAGSRQTCGTIPGRMGGRGWWRRRRKVGGHTGSCPSGRRGPWRRRWRASDTEARRVANVRATARSPSCNPTPAASGMSPTDTLERRRSRASMQLYVLYLYFIII